MTSYSYTYTKPTKTYDGKIEFHTNDPELFARIDHYIHTLIDAEQWRRHLHEVKRIEIGEEPL
jgi:hypothetical protein